MIEQYGEVGDLYITPYLRRSRARAKGDAVALRLAHTDVDRRLDQDKLARLVEHGAFALASGSPGTAHVYVPLSEPVPPPWHEALCKGMIAYLGGDKAKHNDNDLLRPVGAYNLKPTVFDSASARQVSWTVRPNGKRADPWALAALFGVDLSGAGEGVVPRKRRRRRRRLSDPRMDAVADLQVRFPTVWKALQKRHPEDNRSDDTYRIVNVCHEAGLNLPQTEWVVRQREDIRKRLDNEGHSDDVERCWMKAEGRGDDSAEGPDQLEDAHMGEYIADHYLGRFLFCGGLGWLKFDQRRWKRVPETTAAEAIRQAVISIHTVEAHAGADVNRLHKLTGMLSAAKLRSLLWVARNYLAAKTSRLGGGAEDMFDAHPHLLNVRNGVVDLRDGSLHPHDPKLLLTKVAMVDYMPDAIHPDWDKALAACRLGDADWLQLRLGQGITGHPPPDDVVVTLKGSGANGKTTLIDSVRETVGSDYAVVVPERALLARVGDHPTELTTLRGTRLAFLEEFPELGHLNVKRIKDLTAPRLSARYIGRDPMEWTTTHSLFVTTNYLPRVDESDHGTWRRLLMVDFPYRFLQVGESAEAQFDRPGDQGLRERLRRGDDKQHEAVLAWLVAGAVQWYRQNREMGQPTKGVIEATDAWRMTSDVLLRYMTGHLIFDPNSHVMARELYDDFSEWLSDSGHMVWSDQSFCARFAQHPEVTARRVEKKQGVRSSRGGLSRRPTLGVLPVAGKQYIAWLGVRFRTEQGT